MTSRIKLSNLRKDCTVFLSDNKTSLRRSGQRKWFSIPEMIGFLPFREREFFSLRYPYRTGLYDRDEFAPKPVFSRQWHVDFRQTFSSFETRAKFKVDAWEVYGGHPSLIEKPMHFGVSSPEALIFSGTRNLAQDVLRHINAAMLLFNGYTPFPPDDIHVTFDQLTSMPAPPAPREPTRAITRIATNGVVSSCKFVAKIWNDDLAKLALARFYHSTQIAYNHPLDASPSFGDFTGFDTSSFPLMSYALAITAAYSVIEELRFDPRPKKDEYVYKEGKWNPRIVEDVELRLRQSGIRADEEVIWAVRGRASLIERKVAPPAGQTAEWNRPRVRDRLVPLSEAILLSSRIRHRAAAHATKAETRALTPVDLLNVQMVCRYLLMAYAGMPMERWRQEESSALVFRH